MDQRVIYAVADLLERLRKRLYHEADFVIDLHIGYLL